ncbi:phage shock protein C, PspC [Chloroherpeton thalassium ATCC 35110]|uniref:Phage shock protein C, PspC n=1 Tax=Chloroherpeton thalassium (strain ATCC 35110 / GB-78) TaxID=517418 RepID=B3QSS2_CHLT3|nr:PspC domain-containing protein [Chloroherpeton thalassium]ACF14119.1 phage shock protein C, PspC [Chloroherpeton thalassium ATCC 35110]
MRKLYRSRSDKMLAGIFGGLAEYFGLDATLLRLAAVILALATAVMPLVITYLIAWFIVPEK